MECVFIMQMFIFSYGNFRPFQIVAERLSFVRFPKQLARE